MAEVVAALYVLDRGPYFGVDGVEPWALPHRDARTYAGPHPVVAHPPCARWGRYATGGPSHHGRFRVGDDDGCFEAALEAVRRWGGVLEHPKDSKAWEWFCLLKPKDGWTGPDAHGGWTVCVEQGHYGHTARKQTWLYAVGCFLPELPRSVSVATRIKHYGTAAEDKIRSRRRGAVELMTKRERAETPPRFRDLLVAMARSVERA